MLTVCRINCAFLHGAFTHKPLTRSTILPRKYNTFPWRIQGFTAYKQNVESIKYFEFCFLQSVIIKSKPLTKKISICVVVVNLFPPLEGGILIWTITVCRTFPVRTAQLGFQQTFKSPESYASDVVI